MTTPILLLAGIDPTGGAGLLADAAAARACGCLPLGIPTMLTVQNSRSFVRAEPVDPVYLAQALQTLSAEFSFDTVKVGLVPVDDAEWLTAVGEAVRARCRRRVIVPILRPTAAMKGTRPTDAYLAFLSGAVLTPNLRELTLLAEAAGVAAPSPAEAARALARRLDAAIVVTFEGAAATVLLAEKEDLREIPITLVPTERPVHGTGCRFSTSLACFFAQGASLSDAVTAAAAYLTETMRRRERFHPEGQEFLVS